jgi:cell division transport system permease protein
MRSAFVFQEIWIGLRRNLTMTVALIVVVAISLSLLGTGLLFVKQVDNTKTFWQSKVEVSIYLCTQSSPNPACKTSGVATQADRQAILTRLTAMKQQVDHVTYVSQETAYQEFKTLFKSINPSMVSSVTSGDIPDSFQVKLKNPSTDFDIVQSAVQGAPGVDSVINDMTILNKFYKLLGAARDAVVAIALILVVAAVLLVANTIRLSAFNRRRETSIMRLVGASNFYIQLPFLLEGVFAGLLGWGISAGLLVMVKSLLLGNLQQYFSYNVGLTVTDLVEVIAVAMVVGVLLTGATSFLTLRRYLRV